MSFWSQLAKERELRGVSLDEVADRTKITRFTLERMEMGDPNHLPGKAYIIGYLRSYAEAVGLDAEDIVLRYEEESLKEGQSISARITAAHGLLTQKVPNYKILAGAAISIIVLVIVLLVVLL